MPVRIVNLTDVQALENSIVENLQRRDVHPLEEAQGFRALLNLEEPKYSIEQIAAKTGKSPGYVATRLKMTELAAAVVDAFSRDEIGVGHVLLLAKLPQTEQQNALTACFREDWGGASKSKRILLPVRNLQQWIEQNVMLVLKLAPFDTKDAQLVPVAGSCIDCPKRTGHNTLLFAEIPLDSCTDPACYHSKVSEHVAKTLLAKPKLIQITTAYGQPHEGTTVLPRNQYVEIKQQKPTEKERKNWPEYKTCSSMTEAIITEGIDKGEIRRICADPACSVHHPKKVKAVSDGAEKVRQEQERREQALANATGLRVLSAIVTAVPVRLMKRDLLFVVERVMPMLDEQRLEIVARNRGIKKAKEGDAIAKLLSAYVRRADEGELGRLLVELVLLSASRSQAQTGNLLKEAAQYYKVDTDAIALKVKDEFADREKAQTAKKLAAKAQPRPQKKAKAA